MIKPNLKKRGLAKPAGPVEPKSIPSTESAVGDENGTPNYEMPDQATPPHANAAEPDETSTTTTSDIQILDLHGYNPIISYQNQIYSCTWSDMIGTNMFFSRHDDDLGLQPLRSIDTYDLLGISRIKLVAQKAKMTVQKDSKKRARAVDDEGRTVAEASEDEEIVHMPAGKSLGNLRFTNAKINADIRRQAKFLEKFMDIKRSKGETDNVRMVHNRHIVRMNTLGKRRQPSGQTSAQMKWHTAVEIDKLNRRVIRGDAEALARLQEIYSRLDDEAAATNSLQSQGIAYSGAAQDPAAGAGPQTEKEYHSPKE